MAADTFNVNSAMQMVTIKVTGLRRLAIRLAIAVALFRLGAWVAGCMVDIEAPDAARDERGPRG